MDHLDFDPHALAEMARDSIPVEAVYHVVGDADRVLDRDDGVTEYTGSWGDMTIVVVAPTLTSSRSGKTSGDDGGGGDVEFDLF